MFRISIWPAIFVVVLVTAIEAAARQGQLVSDSFEDRPLTIYLPKGYDQYVGNFRVAYFHDGQFLFGEYNGAWNLRKQLDSWIGNGTLDPIVVVGIHSLNSRSSDMVPYFDSFVDENFGTYSPRAAKHASFIVKQLLPYLESKYKISNEPEGRAIMGASFGGLHALWVGAKYPEVFSTIGALSPSIWVANNRIYREFKGERKNQRVYFDIGTLEWNYYTPLIAALEKNGLVYGENIFYFEDHGGMHNATSWSRRVILPLLVFNGVNNSDILEMEVKVEVIKSANSNRFYQRLNPVVSMANGFRYSLNRFATFEIISGEGEVTEDGRFELTGGHLKVRVGYQDKNKEVELKRSDINSIKEQLLK